MCSLWEVLSEQAIEVFIAPTLPRRMGIGKIAANAKQVFKNSIGMELRSIIKGDGLK